MQIVPPPDPANRRIADTLTEINGQLDEVANIAYELRTRNLLTIAFALDTTVGAARRHKALTQAFDRLGLTNV